MEAGMSESWPAAIPRDYKQLFDEYGDFIAYTCQRYGRQDQAPADLLQYTWERLLHVDVLNKYVSCLTTNSTMPDTVSTLEACALLGVGFGAWRSAHWSYQVIFKKVLGGKAPVGAKNRGMTKIRGLRVRCKLCKGAGTMQEVPCSKCKGEGQAGEIRGERWVLWMPEPLPVDGKPVGPVSSKARFKTKQVIQLAEMGYFKGICVNLPTPTATVSHFKNYLRQCIKNHFANWVRTNSRRHKERPADMFAQFRDPDGEGFNMEDRIVDTNSTGRMEATVDIARVMGRAGTDELFQHKEGLLDLLGEGYSLAEAAKKLGLSSQTRAAVQRALQSMT